MSPVPVERSDAFAAGRSAKSGTMFYSVLGEVLGSQSTRTFYANTDAYEPFFVETPIRIDRLAFEITTTAGSNARVGVYRATRDWQPMGAPLCDSGDISVATTGVKTYTPSTPLYLARGRYLGVKNVGVNAAHRSVYASAGVLSGMGASPFLLDLYVARTYGAFPTPGQPWTNGSGDSPTNLGLARGIFYRVVNP